MFLPIEQKQVTPASDEVYFQGSTKKKIFFV